MCRSNFRMRHCWIIAAVWLIGGVSFAEPQVIVQTEGQSSSASVMPSRMGDQAGLAVRFEGTDDLHYYARKETAPGGFRLTVTATGEGVHFGQAVYPEYKLFHDKGLEKDVEVFVGAFTVFVPMEPTTNNAAVEYSVEIKGIACTSKICLPPFSEKLTGTMDPGKAASWPTVEFKPGFEPPMESTAKPKAGEAKVIEGRSMNLPIALALAILAGLSFNIMPCVLPVLPLVLMRLIDQSRQNTSRRIGLGLAFCGGIILFFVLFAAMAVVLKFSTGAVVDWSNHLRYPAVVTTMGLLLVVFALFMFDVFTIGLPSSIAGKTTSGGGAAGSIGMGFLAALLSTPCSGAILAAVLVWAQTQHWAISSLAIVLMGTGMAIPYGIVVFVPGFLRVVPRPGLWMDIFRKSMGFVLLVISVKLLASLPRETLGNVLFYGIVLSFCVWMWGGWVSFSTPTVRKWSVRWVAVIIAILAGFMMLRSPVKFIDWQSYDSATIRKAVEEKRPVVIKFTADWCTNCVFVERKVYQDANVARLIRSKGALAIKADTTLIDYPATVDLRQVYGESGTVPTTIVLAGGQPPIKLRGIFDKQELIRILEPLPEGGN